MINKLKNRKFGQEQAKFKVVSDCVCELKKKMEIERVKKVAEF